jgi:hypothetical protein
VSAQVWSDEDLRCLERDYDSDHGGHDDVVALVHGAQALLRRHRPIEATGCCVTCCTATGGQTHAPYPCDELLTLSLEPTNGATT